MPESRHRRRRGRSRASGSRRPGPTTAAARPRQRKKNWLYIAASGLIAVLVIGGFAIGTAGFGHGGIGGRGQGSASSYVEGIGVQHDIMPTRNHVPEGQTVQYNSVPPTSGDHWPQWSRCGFYEEEIPDERVGHNLEHSNIILSYNLADPEAVDELREVFNDIGLANVTGVARPYDKIEPGHVALSGWGVSDDMVGVDKERIERFFETYAGRLGPEGNIPCLNSGVTP